MYFIHDGVDLYVSETVETTILGRGETPQEALQNYINEWGINARLAVDIARELDISDIYSGMSIASIANAANDADVVVVWNDTFLDCGADAYCGSGSCDRNGKTISRFDTEEAFRKRWCENPTDDAA